MSKIYRIQILKQDYSIIQLVHSQNNVRAKNKYYSPHNNKQYHKNGKNKNNTYEQYFKNGNNKNNKVKQLRSKNKQLDYTTTDIISLKLNDISANTRKFYHDDLCTYDANCQLIEVIDSNINKKYIVGTIIIDKKIIYGYNKKHNPYYLFTPIMQHFPQCLVAINGKINKSPHLSKYNLVIKYANWTKKLPYGQLIKVLGKINDEYTQYQTILYQHNILPLHNKKNPIINIPNITYDTQIYDIVPKTSLLNEYKYISLTDLKIITIDPGGTLDIDDALSYEHISSMDQYTQNTDDIIHNSHITINTDDNNDEYRLNTHHLKNFHEYKLNNNNNDNLSGIHRVGIHITDVSFWIDYLNLHDYMEHRQFTVYAKYKTFNIFPKIFSEYLFSLHEHQHRLAITLFIDFIFDYDTNKFIMIDYKFAETIIKVYKNLSYKQANRFIDDINNNTNNHPNNDKNANNDKTNANNHTNNHTNTNHHKKKKPNHKKKKKITNILKMLFLISKDIVNECEIEIFDTHEMIQKYMILCNKIVAEYLVQHNQSFILRVHNNSNNDYNVIHNNSNYHQIQNEKVKKFIQYYLTEPGTYIEYNTREQHLKQPHYQSDKIKCTIHDKTIIDDNVGTQSNNYYHFGLNLEYYTHFTSPIRRTVDIYNHVVLKNVLQQYLNNNKRYHFEKYDLNKINECFSQNKLIQRKIALISIKSKLKNTDKNKIYTGYLIDFNNTYLKIYFDELDYLYSYNIHQLHYLSTLLTNSIISDLITVNDDEIEINNDITVNDYETHNNDEINNDIIADSDETDNNDEINNDIIANNDQTDNKNTKLTFKRYQQIHGKFIINNDENIQFEILK